MIAGKPTDIIRQTARVNGTIIFLREYYTGRGLARFLIVIVAFLLWLALAVKLFYPVSTKPASLGAISLGLFILAVLGFGPCILIYRAIVGHPVLIQLDKTGITEGARFTPWSDVAQIDGAWSWLEFGYQLSCYYKSSRGVRHSLAMDRPLNRHEFSILMINLQNATVHTGVYIAIEKQELPKLCEQG